MLFEGFIFKFCGLMIGEFMLLIFYDLFPPATPRGIRGFTPYNPFFSRWVSFWDRCVRKWYGFVSNFDPLLCQFLGQLIRYLVIYINI